RSLRSGESVIEISRGDRLFSEGDPGEKLYVVLEGKIKLSRAAPDGRENLLSVHGPGEMFGELSLFDPSPRTSSATAVTDAKLAELVGASRETVNKALADFVARGWVQLSAKSVLLLDPERLRKRARGRQP